MKRLLVVILLLAAGGVRLGFYRGWVGLASDSDGGHSNVTLTGNQDKFQQDRKAALHQAPPPGPSSAGGVAAEGVTAGTVAGVGDGLLTVTDGAGKEQRFTLAPTSA